MEFNFSPLLECQHLLPISPARLAALPDIIDIRCGRIGIALYLYPISSWHWQWNIQKQAATMNSLTPWFARYCFEIVMPTLTIEYTVF